MNSGSANAGASIVSRLAEGTVEFTNTETVLEAELETARSGRPSPFRSATATEYGRKADGKTTGVPKWNVLDPGVVVFSATVAFPAAQFAVAMSGLPSLSKSAITIESGVLAPILACCWGAKLGITAPGDVVFRRIERNAE